MCEWYQPAMQFNSHEIDPFGSSYSFNENSPIDMNVLCMELLEDFKTHHPNIPNLPPEVLEQVLKAASHLGLIPPIKF
jgi:hypothetical protein